MTDYSELIKQLRISGHPTPSLTRLLRVNAEAADALEAQAKGIEKLRSDLRLHAGDCASLSNELDLMREQRNIADVENAELHARIAELEWTVEELRRQARGQR
jgi:chromosome segregation ATPase